MKTFQHKKIGIWGLGTVGTAAADWFAKQKAIVTVTDSRMLTAQEYLWLHERQITYTPIAHLNHFLQNNDYLLASAGVDTRLHYQTYKDKWLTEVDLYHTYANTYVIGITGTVGKTSTTHALTHVLKAAKKHALHAGNIGVPLFDILNSHATHTVLELSSFQLEHIQQFAPDIAIITNISENHLDRHHTMDAYIQAKLRILMWQTNKQIALVPASLLPPVKKQFPTKHLYTFSTTQPKEHAICDPYVTHFWLENNLIVKHQCAHDKDDIIPLFAQPDHLYTENWLIINCVMHLLGIQRLYAPVNIPPLPHRLEFCGTIGTLRVYNDSKSTTPISTLAAIHALNTHNIHLIIGGLDKGVNRTPFIQELKHRVKRIYCFGAQAHTLFTTCQSADIPAQMFTHVQEVFTAICSHAQSDDVILFSPSGSSFDQFTNYVERGEYFKQLCQQFARDW